MAGIAGSSVEHNKFCVSVHFRNCAPDDYPAGAAVVNNEQACCRAAAAAAAAAVPWHAGTRAVRGCGALRVAVPCRQCRWAAVHGRHASRPTAALALCRCAVVDVVHTVAQLLADPYNCTTINLSPLCATAVVDVVDRVAAAHTELRVTRGRKVLEVRPQVRVMVLVCNQGRAGLEGAHGAGGPAAGARAPASQLMGQRREQWRPGRERRGAGARRHAGWGPLHRPAASSRGRAPRRRACRSRPPGLPPALDRGEARPPPAPARRWTGTRAPRWRTCWRRWGWPTPPASSACTSATTAPTRTPSRVRPRPGPHRVCAWGLQGAGRRLRIGGGRADERAFEGAPLCVPGCPADVRVFRAGGAWRLHIGGGRTDEGAFEGAPLCSQHLAGVCSGPGAAPDRASAAAPPAPGSAPPAAARCRPLPPARSAC